jgi:4-hydroxymandelate oxidase
MDALTVSRPIPPHIVSVSDYDMHLPRELGNAVKSYINGAGADGFTCDANRAAWEKITLEGRVLADLRDADTNLALFGLKLDHPLILAPVAFHGLVHPDGENATALGAAAAGALMVLSTQSGVLMEEVAAQAKGPLWFQLYFQAERDDTLRLIRRAESAGFKALVVTVDAPVNGIRNMETRAGFSLPTQLRAANLDGMSPPLVRNAPGRAATFLGLLDAAPRWDDIEWLKSQTRLPVLLKGIMSTHDARLAVENGADGIVVSNHGGRTLDTLPATAQALPRIVDEIAGRVPVLCDGGIRRGTDVLKALALGATAVMIGRPQLHALAVAGPAGVAHILTILRAELEVAMALTGRRRLSEIDRSTLWE